MNISNISKACDISPGIRKKVLERDDYRCVLCGIKNNLQIAHYISRAKSGLGIPENLITLCTHCHFDYDNGKFHKEYKKRIEDYLKAHYHNWDNTNLIYKKGG